MPARRPRLASVASGVLSAAFAELGRALELPGAFSAEVLAEAESAARSVPTDPDAAALPDLRHIELFTIDPAGSTDLDQALHLERADEGAVLHYAIADVAAFVAAGGAIDAEARRRGQTMYAPDRRVPLHPDILGADAASLLPGVDRRAFVWRFELDDGARPVSTSLTRAIVRSRRQWSYPEAQRAVDGGDAPASLAALRWFGERRRERESERGGASLSVPEVEIEADDGRYRLRRRATLPIETWNAHVSLLTGMSAADIMLRGGVGILRTMPAADDDDVAAFRAQTVALGLPWPEDMRYGDYLRGLDADDPAAMAVQDAAASLFRGAGYAVFDGAPPADPVQAAIAAPYAHTTAPIRRLVDRWSLVICEALAGGREVPAWARESLPELPKLMGRSEHLASRLEAASVDRVEAAVLSGHEGETFDGVVLSARGDTARVQLAHPPVSARVAGLEAPAGSTVRLRLARADISTGEVVLEPTSG
ncbi:MAG: RNB domain-containing ribonuclease [Microbacterium sp.]|uniref:RNB domain-containing ribonuclease n=1 Tax=Microbacterium sp. TaxID=51671 RepID=UPI0039E6D043